MIRRDLRKRLEAKKVTFNNFSKGMEFDNFAKDPSNPRVQYIKNLELQNGKLELRKPALPFIGDNGEYNMVLLSPEDKVQQVFFFPSLNNEARFIWLVQDKDGKYFWAIKVGAHGFAYTEYNSDRFGIADYHMESTYMQHLDTLYVKAPKGIIAVHIDSSGKIVEEAIEEYSPNGWELTDAGLNLFNKDPFDIKNDISHGTQITIDSLLWYKRDRDGNLIPAIAPKFSDLLTLKARLSIPDTIIEKELDQLKADKTKLMYSTDDTITNGYPTLIPKFEWYSKPAGQAEYGKTPVKSGLMPLLATDILVDKTSLSQAYLDIFNKHVPELKTSWKAHRQDLIWIPRGEKENTEYKLVIKFDANAYDLHWEYKTLDHHDLDATININGKHKSDPSHGKWIGYDQLEKDNKLRKILSDDSTDLHISNWNTTISGGSYVGAKNDSTVGEHFEIDFSSPKQIRGVKITRKFSDPLGPNKDGIVRHLSNFKEYWYGGRHGDWVYKNHLSKEYFYPAKYEYIKNAEGVNILNKEIKVGSEKISYNEYYLPDQYRYDPIVDAVTELDGVEYRIRPVTNRWFHGDTGKTKSFTVAQNKGWYTGATDQTRTWPGTGTSPEYDRTAAQTYNVNFKCFGWSQDTQDNAYTQKNPAFFVQKSNSSFPNMDATIMNDIELVTSGLITKAQYISFGDPKYSKQGVALLYKHLDIYLTNDYNNVGLWHNWVEQSNLYAQSHHDDGTPGITDAVRFGTHIINKIELLTTGSSNPDDAEFAGAVLKYSSLKNPTSEYKWDLQNSRYLFQYWESLGLYGFDKEAGVNKPYNYIMLSEPDNLSYFPNTKILDVYSQDNHLITKVLPWKNNLLGFTESSTTMFIGRDGAQKETISTTTGLSEFDRNTAQVVSNSVVFKNGSSVIAFVPAPGTDNAASLNIRDISKQISERIKQLDRENPKALFSVVYKHEYWLCYRFDGRTVILKYSWDNFAWTEAEYRNEYIEMFQYNANTIVAVDTKGHLYNLTSLKVSEDMEHIVARAFYNGSTENGTGTLADIPGPYMDVGLDRYEDVKGKNSTGTLKLVHLDYVYDGDTFTDTDGNHYRILGVNTPELKGSTGNQKIYAELAKQTLKDLLAPGNIEVEETGATSYNRKVARIYVNGVDIGEKLLAAGVARVDYISNNASDKYYFADNDYINKLKEAQADAQTNKVGMWSLIDDNDPQSISKIQAEIFQFNAIYSNSLLGAEWQPKYSEIPYEFILGNRKTSVEDNMMTEEVTAVLGNEGNSSTLKESYMSVHTDNMHMKDYWFDTSHGAPTPHRVTDFEDLFHNWRIGTSTNETPTIQGHTFKIRKSAKTLNIKISGEVAQKIYLDSVQFKFRETNRRAR